MATTETEKRGRSFSVTTMVVCSADATRQTSYLSRSIAMDNGEVPTLPIIERAGYIAVTRRAPVTLHFAPPINEESFTNASPMLRSPAMRQRRIMQLEK